MSRFLMIVEMPEINSVNVINSEDYIATAIAPAINSIIQRDSCFMDAFYYSLLPAILDQEGINASHMGQIRQELIDVYNAVHESLSTAINDVSKRRCLTNYIVDEVIMVDSQTALVGLFRGYSDE